MVYLNCVFPARQSIISPYNPAQLIAHLACDIPRVETISHPFPSQLHDSTRALVIIFEVKKENIGNTCRNNYRKTAHQ